jgi:hypothetical protein
MSDSSLFINHTLFSLFTSFRKAYSALIAFTMDRHIIVIALRLEDNPAGLFRFFSFRQYEHV